jgi:hypothetical protein
MKSPWLQSVVLAVANTPYVLYALLQAVDPRVLRHCQSCQIQVDVGAGGARVYVGNVGTITATNVGVELVASQAYSIPSLSSNILVLDDIAVMSNTNGVRLNITAITR